MPVEILYWWSGVFLVVLLLFGWARRQRRRRDSTRSERPDGRSYPGPVWLWHWLFSTPGNADEGTSGEVTGPMATAPDSLTLVQIRLPAAAMLLGGGLLLGLGLAIKADLSSGEQWWLWALMGIGGLAFVLGGQLVNQRRAPAWIIRPVRRLAGFLSISGGQVALLALAACFALMSRLAAGDALLARQGTVATLSWLLAGGLVVAGSWAWGKREMPRIGRGELVFTAVLLVVAYILRGVNLEGMPDTLSGDEGASGLVALMFRNGEADNLFTFGWFSFPSLYFFIQSMGIRFLGQTTAALRITSAAGGALAVVAAYWLGRILFDRLMGVLTAVYLAVSHYHIHVSRIGLNNIWDSLFGMLAITGLWHGWRGGRRSSFVLAGVALGLGQYFYVSMRALPLIFLLWAGAAFVRDRVTFRRRLPDLCLAAYTAFIVILPFGILAVQQWDNFMAPYSRVSVFADGWLDQEMTRSGETAVKIITDQMLTTALGFTHQPLRLLYDPGAPLLLGGAAALFLMGLLWAVMHLDLKFSLILMPLLFVILTGGFSHDPPASQRFIMTIPLAAILVVLPLRLAVAWLQQLWSRSRPTLLLALGLIIAAIAWGDLHYYFFDVYDSYVLGGGNTEVATHIAHYLRDHEIPEQKVYFFGFPRMGYFSLATIPYLAPDMAGEDVVEPLSAPPAWGLDGPTLFLFLPERLDELELVRISYPGGRYREFFSDKGVMTFAAYELSP